MRCFIDWLARRSSAQRYVGCHGLYKQQRQLHNSLTLRRRPIADSRPGGMFSSPMTSQLTGLVLSLSLSLSLSASTNKGDDNDSRWLLQGNQTKLVDDSGGRSTSQRLTSATTMTLPLDALFPYATPLLKVKHVNGTLPCPAIVAPPVCGRVFNPFDDPQQTTDRYKRMRQLVQ